MKINLLRSDLFRFERLVTKLVKPSEFSATIYFVPSPDGLQIAAYCDTAILTLTVPTDYADTPFTLPWATVKELASRKANPVELDVNGPLVGIAWSESGVPQHRTVPNVGQTEKSLPPTPDKLATHPITLLDALVAAGKCVDPDNARYSLGAVCLRGATAQIISSDGRQALLQDGFSFPWENDVLCPVSKIFGSQELRKISETVKIGAADQWVFFQIGNSQIGDVMFWLKVVEGKFPRLDQFARNIEGHSWLHLDPTDAAFVAERLDSLPGKTDPESPVYVRLDNGIAVRGHDTKQQTATELRLIKSRCEGSPVVTPVNRRFLKNALGFGISRIGFDPKERTPLIGYGEQKMFVIMPLEGDEPPVEPEKITVLASDSNLPVSQKSDKPTPDEKPIPSTKANRTPKPRPKANGKPKSQPALIDEALKLRQNLRETLGGVNDLIRSIKTQRRQDKLLRTTVASLRKLQNV